jgi:hypothetical protein
MFECIVVAFEIAFLSAAFWYVFLREEKPYKIIGDPWGNYSGVIDPHKGEVCGEIRAGKIVVRDEAPTDSNNSPAIRAAKVR